MSTKKAVNIARRKTPAAENEEKTRGRSRSVKPLPRIPPLTTASGATVRRPSVAAPTPRPPTPPVPRSVSRSSGSSSRSSSSHSSNTPVRSASEAPKKAQPSFLELVNKAKKRRASADESLANAQILAQNAKNDPSTADVSKRRYRGEMADAKHESEAETAILSRMTPTEKESYIKSLGEPHKVDVLESYKAAFGGSYEVSAGTPGPSAFESLVGPAPFSSPMTSATSTTGTSSVASSTTATPAVFAVPDVPLTATAPPVRPVTSPAASPARVRPVASPGADVNAPPPPRDMRAIMNERQRRKEAWEAERKTPRLPIPFDPKNLVTDDEVLMSAANRVGKNVARAQVASRDANDAYGEALAAFYADEGSGDLRSQLHAADERSKAADNEYRKAVDFQSAWTDDADFLAKRRAKMQSKREAQLPSQYEEAHEQLDYFHSMREVLDSQLADASLNDERRRFLTKERDRRDLEIDQTYDLIAAMDAALSPEWRERALGLRPRAATTAATPRPPVASGDAMVTSTRDEGLRSHDYSDRLAGLGVARIAAGLPYGGIRDGAIDPIRREEKKGDQKQPNEPNAPANDASSHDDRVVRGYRGGGFIQNRDLPNSSITGRPTKEAGDVVAQAKASYASTTDSLRPQFPIAPAGSLIPDERTQLESQVLHDTFGEVLPGSGLGVTNKLFVMNQLREKNIHFMEPMDLPRRDDGPSCLVVPAPLSLQNVITKDDRSRMQQSLIARDLLAVMTEERAGAGSLNILGNDYGQLSSLSAKTLKRNAESPLEPIHRLPESMTNIRTPTGYTLSFRKSRRLFDALRYPERFDAQCAQSGGATMSVPNSLAMYPFPVGI